MLYHNVALQSDMPGQVLTALNLMCFSSTTHSCLLRILAYYRHLISVFMSVLRILTYHRHLIPVFMSVQIEETKEEPMDETEAEDPSKGDKKVEADTTGIIKRGAALFGELEDDVTIFGYIVLYIYRYIIQYTIYIYCLHLLT